MENLNKGWGLERRKEANLVLKPYRWDTEEGQMNFRALLQAFEKEMELPEPIASGDAEDFDYGQRMYVAAGGHVGIVSKLLVEALKQACLEGTKRIDLALLGSVYASFRAEARKETIDFDRDVLVNPVEPPPELPDEDNPFLCASKRVRDLWLIQRGPSYSPDQEDQQQRGSRSTRVKGTGKTRATDQRAKAAGRGASQ